METGEGRARRMNAETATVIALRALSFLAGDPARLDRFLRLTGTSLDQLRRDAPTARLQVAVLDYLLADESLLLAFAANFAIAPDDVVPAREALAE